MTGVRWMGRIEEAPNGAVRLGYPGITALIHFTGTTLAWRVEATSAHCHFNVSIDNGTSRIVKAAAGRSTLVLAEGLSDGPHVARVVRRTESWPGTIAVEAVTTNGRLLEPPALPERKLLFLGDSITCGAAIDHMPPDFPQDHLDCDAAGSFGMELGHRLSAQTHLVSYGGRGLVRDYQGWGRDKTLIAPVMFERAMPDDASSAWDHQRYTPDAVVIGLGTNDFATGIPDEVEWVNAYDALLTRVRQVHPRALILITNSPMFSPRTDNGDAARAAAIVHYLDEVITKRWYAGDRSAEKVLYRYQPGSSRNSHPARPQHQLMADDLESVLRARLGWRT
jgi:lysophospholipase L1-like esterase